MNFAKPDRHLLRISKNRIYSPHALCKLISIMFRKIQVVDWYFGDTTLDSIMKKITIATLSHAHKQTHLSALQPNLLKEHVSNARIDI